MNKSYFFLFTLLIQFICPSKAQQHPFDRSMITYMVIPANIQKDSSLKEYFKSSMLQSGVSEVNNYLLSKGYSNILVLENFLNYQREVSKISMKDGTEDNYASMIDQAPVDIKIYLDVFWVNPPNQPFNRQVRVKLQAVDHYTALVLSDETSIYSEQRQYPSPEYAINKTISAKSNPQLENFVVQLDKSFLKILSYGRKINFRIQTKSDTKLKLNERINGEKISELIKKELHLLAMNGQIKETGSSANIMNLSIQTPCVDESGKSILPSTYLSEKLEKTLYELGIQSELIVIGGWLNCNLSWIKEP